MGMFLDYKSNSTTTAKVKIYLKDKCKPVKLTVDEIKTEKNTVYLKKGDGTNDYTLGIFSCEEVIGAIVNILVTDP
ncbi:MAG: hypothetical protein OXC82_04055 [Rhodobacteraceae bacterium]|nr:hypothetical protein [Paracoccaceae bacterium]MCY4249595.1 hypothetical protein [Paracoccaceae bacterium]